MPLPDLTTLLVILLVAFVAVSGQEPAHSGWQRQWLNRLIGLLLLSPGLRYVSTLFTFPIRLQLSAWAGYCLRLAGLDVATQGNVLIRDGVEMAVDPACMGLQLTGVSVLVALFFLIGQEKAQQKRLPAGWAVLYSVSAFGLTVLCNLFRIALLVLFSAMPDTWAHELIGLICIGVYAWLPAWLLARWLVQRLGRASATPPRQGIRLAGWWLFPLALALWVFSKLTIPETRTTTTNSLLKEAGFANEDGRRYRRKKLAGGFVQLTRPGVLIYLKPQPDWFSLHHSPMACWQGSGYDLHRVSERTVNGHRAYVGELRRRGRTLYTAWWFTNGTVTTISQLKMRGHLLRGAAGFVLVNITVNDPSMLYSRP